MLKRYLLKIACKFPLLIQLSRQFQRSRRRLFEFFGSDYYSKPAKFGMDKKLEEYLTGHGGFFIEVGAYDGFRESNTYYLEKFKGFFTRRVTLRWR